MNRRVLRRADIGFGRVVLDDTGVRREGLVRTQRLAWDDIEEYRLEIELRSTREDARLLVPGLWDVVGFVRGLAGRSPRRHGIELIGRSGRVFFNWRFRDHTDAIRDVLSRIEPRLQERARSEVARTGGLTAGPLRLGRDAVTWGAQAPLARAELEAIELFDSTTVQLRVMQRGRVRPYGAADTAEIPNLGVVLAVAESLDLPVRGRELL